MIPMTAMSGEPEAKQVAASEFRCPDCNGEMHWDAAASAMRCQFCSKTVQVAEQEGSRSVVEYDLEHGLAMASQRGYGVAVRTTVCKECGATVSFGEATTATRCDFCDSPQVMQQEGSRNVIRPESLVPFAVEKKVATDKFKHWLRKLWFRPFDLKHKAEVEEMHGVYIPYWCFDSNVASHWTAQSGTYYYETETYTDRDASGNTVTKTRQVQKTRWRWTSGNRKDHYDDLLVCASKGLPRDMAEKLRSFDTASLRPWEPGFLAGWKAEEYAVDLNTSWKEAVERMEASQRQRCSGDVPGDTQRFLSVENQFSGERFKHVLLPLWISSYRYQEKVYRFLVNGQTGEVTGKAPLSWFKILLLVVIIAAAAVGIYLLVKR